MITNEIIWITGASSGLGRAIALQLARQKNTVIACGRNTEALNALACESSYIEPMVFDTTDKNGVEMAVRKIQQKHGYIDRAIINAGTCEYFDVNQGDWAMMRRIMEVNYFGAINCIEGALRLFSEKSEKHIAVTASLASVVAFPKAEAYGASKAALHYFCDSLRVDLANKGIAVTVIQPGFVDTPLTRGNDFPMPFKLSVDEAVTALLKHLEEKKQRIQFPKRLAWPLQLMGKFPRLWHWLAVRFLAKPTSAV